MRLTTWSMALVLTLAAAHPAGAETPYAADPLTVEASAAKLELAVRLVTRALAAPRSDDFAARDEVVCRKQTQVGSHIPVIVCTTNEGWLYQRKYTSRIAFGSELGVPYNARERPLYRIRMGDWNRLQQRHPEVDRWVTDAERIETLRMIDAAAELGDEAGTPAATVVRFARAFAAVAAAGDEARAERALAAEGFSFDEYNALVERLETSAAFQRRVNLALAAATR